MRDGTGCARPIGYKSGDGWLPGVSVFAKRAGKVARASDTGLSPGDDPAPSGTSSSCCRKAMGAGGPALPIHDGAGRWRSISLIPAKPRRGLRRLARQQRPPRHDRRQGKSLAARRRRLCRLGRLSSAAPASASSGAASFRDSVPPNSLNPIRTPSRRLARTEQEWHQAHAAPAKVPDGHTSSRDGWQDNYFDPMKEYFAKRG
jgi:hypothetical protein